MNNKTNIEEDIEQLKSLKADRESFVMGEKEHDEIYLKDIQAIENILADRERYKRLAEQNLKDSEEFKNNMCEHRCVKYNETLQLQAKANKYDSLIKEIEDKINKRKIKYNEILNDYGNIDTDVIFNIPNKNVRKRLDELSFEITTLQELLDKKEEI